MHTKVNPLVLFLLLGITGLFAQTKAERIDQLLNTYAEYGKFNGSYLVSENGKVVTKGGVGFANMEWKIPNSADTKHRLASVSKQFTAVLILQLVNEGKLDLQKPISTYLPDYPKKTGEKITTHQLLSHTSGVPNYTSFPNFFEEISRDPYTTTEMLEMFQGKELDFEPGENFSYSNSGYFLLGVLIETLREMSYSEAVEQYLFEPLGMNDSGYDLHTPLIERRASGYTRTGTGFVNAPYIDMTIPYAAGSLYSTVEDLHRWDRALYTEQLLPGKVLAMAYEPHASPSPAYSYGYGFGLADVPVGSSEDTVATIAHDGGINGFSTLFVRFPDNQSAVILLDNTQSSAHGVITQAVNGILRGKPYDLPKPSLVNEVVDRMEKQGTEAGLRHLREKHDDSGYDVSEYEINGLGYRLLGDNEVDAALMVFEINTELNPESANVWDSYAEAFMKKGDTARAIENYRKSYQMDPANKHALDMLKEMGDDVTDLEKKVEIPAETLEDYTGNYELMPGFVLTIRHQAGELFARATGQPELSLYAIDQKTFRVVGVPAKLLFNLSEEGKTESVTLFQGGQELTGAKK